MLNGVETIEIINPKRTKRSFAEWDAFFPYYAGYPTAFVERILKSVALEHGSVVADPWNGSGTTTYAAARAGYRAVGMDLNPVMAIVAHARLIDPSDAARLNELGRQVVAQSQKEKSTSESEMPMMNWFDRETSKNIIQMRNQILSSDNNNVKLFKDDGSISISKLNAACFVALISVVRHFAQKYKTSNPTWMRTSKSNENTIAVEKTHLHQRFLFVVQEMSKANAALSSNFTKYNALIKVGDATVDTISNKKVDLIISSPSYCTRIDYASATRLELAILDFADSQFNELRRRMTGTTVVNGSKFDVCSSWGETCCRTIDLIKGHYSRASATYYLKTHVDYYNKLYLSIENIASSLNRDGSAIIVVQDSYYKDIHNDLPTMICEMAENVGLALRRRDDFTANSLAAINAASRRYRVLSSATESVLCFGR